MQIWKSVVGKLWMTIIGLVALVLLINSLLLAQFIDNNFANTKDQVIALQKLAVKVAKEVPHHLNDEGYLQIVNELLTAQEAAMILVHPDFSETVPSVDNDDVKRFLAADIFQQAELEEIFRGGLVYTPYQNGRIGEQYLAVGVPILVNERVTHGIVLYQKQISLENTQAYFKKLFIYAIIIGFLLTTFFAFFLSTRITKPLLQMKQAADFIAMGDYRTRVPIPSSDEIGELAKTFNHMTERLEETIIHLNHEKEHLASVLLSMTDAVITFDANGNVILTNPQGERIIQEWGNIQWTDPEPEPFHRRLKPIPEPLRPLFESVVEDTNELTSKLNVHNGVWSVVITPLYSNDNVRGAVAVLRDVTEEYRLDKLRKDFVANVSHELRTPLSMLQGYSEALLDDIAASPQERRELAQVIHDESLRMGRLVKDLLDLARMEAGHLELNYRELDLKPLIMRVHRKFSALCKERGISLKADLSKEPLIVAKADEDRLEQVLTNLLGNAVRHTPEHAEITIRSEQLTYNNKKALLIAVEDQGHGIPAEDLPYIFERFYKADKARKRGATGGTGLGLAIVKNIVEAHQGTVSVSSTLGRGTTFSIILPAFSTD